MSNESTIRLGNALPFVNHRSMRISHRGEKTWSPPTVVESFASNDRRSEDGDIAASRIIAIVHKMYVYGLAIRDIWRALNEIETLVD